jgi:hypothetical protein
MGALSAFVFWTMIHKLPTVSFYLGAKITEKSLDVILSVRKNKLIKHSQILHKVQLVSPYFHVNIPVWV